MARATNATSNDPATGAQSGDWQALRGELVALLNQVEGRLGQAPAIAAAPQAQPAGQHPADPQSGGQRHREALRSVKKAIDRFSPEPSPFEAERPDSRELPPNPQHILQSAILDIRSRHRAPRAVSERPAAEPAAPRLPQAAAVLPEATARQFDAFARSVGTISGRLERLEVAITSQSGNGETVREIADQIGQLTHVVELLAGAVGETGQVKRLESQIAGLARLVAEGPRLDFSALTERMDDVSSTVARLAELQIEQTSRERDAQPPAEAIREGMASVEETLRAVYDRIDGMEKSVALPPDALDRLTDEVAEINAAMRSGAMRPDGLVELIEALGMRLDAMDGREDAALGGLRDDVLALRGAVVGAMEPRFSALQLQIEALTDRVTDGPTDASLSQLEAQVRQLAARMDQTGEQLTGLARLYNRPDSQETLPDLDALADLVASRTSDAIRETAQPAPQAIADDSLAALEARMAGLFRAAAEEAANAAPQALVGMEDGIRRVDERLERLEQSLVKLRQPVDAPVSDLPERHPSLPKDLLYVKISEPRPTLPEADEDLPFLDTMPASPDEDRPLTDPGFPDPGPIRAALEERNGSRPRPAEPVAARPHFDPASVTPPPRPQSSLELGDIAFTPPPSAPAEAPVERPADPAISRSTFIEAARRAAQRQNAQKVEANATSLIGRAMARFQQAGETIPAEPVTAPKARDAAPQPVRIEPAAISDAPAPLPLAPDAEPDSDEDAPRESFLTRHRQPILLAASIVAICFLTLNLIGQRNEEARLREVGSATATSAPAATPDTPEQDAATANSETGSQSSVDSAPDAAVAGRARAIPMTDSLVTGSIDPGAANSFAPSTGQLPADRFAGNTPVTITPVALPQPVPALPVTGAVQVEMPPEGVGPLGLREAAGNGDPRAQFEVAAIYTEGRAIAQDFDAAAIWYERAAAQGFAPAQYRLGNLYENGRGVEQDLDQARLWYQRAAEADNRMSMHNLAALLAGGQLGEQEFAAAAEWFEQAALRGLTDSQFNLGMLYARGLGVPQNMEASYKWFSLAAASGDADAVKARDDVARSLDAEAVSRVAAELADWEALPVDLAANFAPIGTWNESFDPGAAIADQNVVSNVQAALGRLGYDVGEPDGIPGPKTAQAIREFERATGMTEVGAINPRLLAVLGSQPV